MKTKRKAIEVTEPVVRISHDDNSCTAIYVLRDTSQKFRMPGVKDESPRAWDYGPSIITERYGPFGCNTVTHNPEDAGVWRWLGALIKIGAHVMQDDKLASQIPKDLKEYWHGG